MSLSLLHCLRTVDVNKDFFLPKPFQNFFFKQCFSFKANIRINVMGLLL